MKTVFRPLVNPFQNDTFATTTLFRKQISTGNQRDLRVRKETINKLSFGLICLKIRPSRKNKIYLYKKNGSEARDVLASVTVPVGRGRKMRTALRTKETARFVTLPSEKKRNICYSPLGRSVLRKTVPEVSRWYSGGTQDPIFPIRTDLDW